MHKLRLYGFFVGLMIATLLTCDALAFKVIHIYGYNFSASGLIFPISLLFSCVVTDTYGYSLAGRIIYIQILSQFFFICVITIFVYLPSPNADPTALIYRALYKNLWRVLLASSVAVPLAYFFNEFIMSKLKIYYNGKAFFFDLLLLM